MQYNQVGRTDIRLSAVGMGTCQLRLVPEKQALSALKRGFKLGVNWVHTAPDYGGAEPLIARAILESGRDITVLSNGFGEMSHFEHLFETTCRTFGKQRLEMYGISCIDDHEHIKHNVWNPGGMVDFLERKKAEGRIKSLFCSTHGPPEYVARLITCGVFDAVMLSYNPLGFHVLSYYGKAEGKVYEEIDRIEKEIFPLALESGVGLLVMKPLAGGMLCRSKAFPPHHRFSREEKELTARDVLRAILAHPAVCAVVPGTASVEEAEENALAGHGPVEIDEEERTSVKKTVEEMRAALCSRCGECESTCSKSLPISWLFRDAYIWNYPSDTFEALGRLHYFHLHPDEELACVSCTERTCICPSGIDLPAGLAGVHEQMQRLREQGRMHALPEEMEKNGPLAAKVVWCEFPHRLDGEGLCRFWIENASDRVWERGAVVLAVCFDNKPAQRVPLRHDVHPGERTHFAFQLKAPWRSGRSTLTFNLASRVGRKLKDETPLSRSTIVIETSRLGRLLARFGKR